MNPHERDSADPDDYEPADTLVLNEDAVMETSEFRKLVDLESDLVDEIEPPDNL